MASADLNLDRAHQDHPDDLSWLHDNAVPAKIIVDLYDPHHPKHTTFAIAAALPYIIGYDHPQLKKFGLDLNSPTTKDILTLYSSNERKQPTSLSTYFINKRYALGELERVEETFLSGSSTHVEIRFISPDWSLLVPSVLRGTPSGTRIPHGHEIRSGFPLNAQMPEERFLIDIVYRGSDRNYSRRLPQTSFENQDWVRGALNAPPDPCSAILAEAIENFRKHILRLGQHIMSLEERRSSQSTPTTYLRL